MMKSIVLYFILAIPLIIIDQLIKFFILLDKQIIYRNKDLVFGFKSPFTALVVIAVLLVFVAFSIYEIKKNKPFYFLLGLSFILGGGISNIIDRLRLGGVTDYLDLTYWIFNLADIYIFAGLIILIVFYLKGSADIKNSKQPISS